MTFAEFYDSFYQHPTLLWVAAVLGWALALSRGRLSASVQRFCTALAAVALLDAWLTTTNVPGVGRLTGQAASLIPLLFVLLGDFRYFVFIESTQPNGTLHFPRKAVAKACGWTLLVPLGAQLAFDASGAANPRVLFLVYELLFVGLAIAIDRLYLPRRSDALRWTRPVTRFVIAYYALWATSDAIILASGADVGFLLRVFPNALYYGGLVPVIAWTAPIADR